MWVDLSSYPYFLTFEDLRGGSGQEVPGLADLVGREFREDGCAVTGFWRAIWCNLGLQDSRPVRIDEWTGDNL